MGIDLYAARAHADSLNSSASDISAVKDMLTLFKNRLPMYWNADEMRNITVAIDQLISEANSISTDLRNISSDIIITANEIKHEEEVAKARKEFLKAQEILNKRKVKYSDTVQIYIADPSDYNEQCVRSEYSRYSAARVDYDNALRKLRSLESQ